MFIAQIKASIHHSLPCSCSCLGFCFAFFTNRLMETEKARMVALSQGPVVDTGLETQTQQNMHGCYKAF